jgi:hypothetical protein
MSPDEWNDIVRPALLGRWGTASTDLNAQRSAVWQKSFGALPLATVRAAILRLERTARAWPPLCDMHAALDAVRRPRPRLVAEPVGAPSTPADWRAGAALLRRGIADHLRRGNPSGNPRHRWLLQLAEFWDGNAARAERGEPHLWPPPAPPRSLFGGAHLPQRPPDRARKTPLPCPSGQVARRAPDPTSSALSEQSVSPCGAKPRAEVGA